MITSRTVIMTLNTLRPGKVMIKNLTSRLTGWRLKQQFFAAAIVAKNKFENAEVKWETPADTSLKIIAKATANLRVNIPEGQSAVVPLQLFYGPSDYDILKSYNNQMYNMVPLGSRHICICKVYKQGICDACF